jgi:hypothetical protein
LQAHKVAWQQVLDKQKSMMNAPMNENSELVIVKPIREWSRVKRLPRWLVFGGCCCHEENTKKAQQQMGSIHHQ